MQRSGDVNPLFAEWKSSTDQQKAEILPRLVAKMTNFATAICWQRIPDFRARGELEPLVNGIVWRAVRQFDKFEGKSRFSTWFYRIVVNECNRFLRDHKERYEDSLEEEMPSKAENVDAHIDVVAILEGLEGADHLLFRLVAEGYSFKEIGEWVGVSTLTALKRWERLKEKIRNAV